MLTGNCWCCPTCCNPSRSSRRRERKISFRQTSPPKKQACSLPNPSFLSPVSSALDQQREHYHHSTDLHSLLDSTDPTSDYHLDPGWDACCVGDPGKQEETMCVRCQRRKAAEMNNSDMFPADDILLESFYGQPNNRNGVVPVDTTENDVHASFVEAFLHNNRLEHMVQVMGYHPRYLDAFLKTQEYMLRLDGPLPYNYRHYIAIMAAGRHQCSYLIQIQANEFVLQGGDSNWLKGLQYAPKKLSDLCEINKILAHRPWLLTKAHVEKLTRGNDNWSISELMHAIVILAHFHALSSFVYGCGINAEVESHDGHTLHANQSSPPSSTGSGLSPPAGSGMSVVGASGTSPSGMNGGGSTSLSSSTTTGSSTSGSAPSSSSMEEGGGIEVLMERMRKLTKDASEEMSQEELQKRFERIETQSAEMPAASKQPSPKADVLRYVEDPDFTYQDFAKRGTPSDIPTFRVQDYSWEEQGFSLANRLYSDIGRMLDDKFSIAKDLTYYTMGDRTDVDTTSFRRAIWNYIHLMFGIRHDDYDYSEVNQLLERPLKAYIKTVTCYPERITKKDYESFMREFKHSEKVHVNLMLLEARIQGELLYALRAIMKHMT